jgi:hypothetical protein
VNYWAYPQVWITDLVVNNQAATWLGPFAISLVTSFDTVSAGPQLPIRGMPSLNPTFSGTLNGGNVNFPFAPGGTYLGYQAGQNAVGAGTFNTFVGYQAGALVTSGFNNTFVGLQAGAAATTCQANTAIGLQVMQALTTGNFNTALGIHALLSLIDGTGNVCVGGGSMEYMTSGNANVSLGMYAGRDNQGSSNVFLGDHAGMTANASNQLYIANNETTALIRGDFSTLRVWVCGGADDGVNAFQVNGSIRFRPAASSTPVSNGDLTFEATSNTSLKIKFKGSDGVVRSATLTLS